MPAPLIQANLKTGLFVPLSVSLLLLGVAAVAKAGPEPAQSTPADPARVRVGWNSPNRFRLWLDVDPRGRPRSNAPASVEVDFQQSLREQRAAGTFDEFTIEVHAARQRSDQSQATTRRVPHRLDRLFGTSRARLSFVLPEHTWTNFIVYFDTLESGHGRPDRYPGLVGDGDKFCETYGRREIAASHFDCFVDFDGDGDLDLFKGGVEPFVLSFENVGNNRLVERGRLASDDQVLKLPSSRANRSWLTVAFHDVDRDGDQDFFPSFGDGPDAGKIIFYRNSRERSGSLKFTRVGPLETVSGIPLAGGAQAGGWFPSLAFVSDWDGDGRGPDALVGSKNACWFYGSAGTNEHGALLFVDPVAVQAGGQDILLTNPRFAAVDIDGDVDLDLFAATQPGPVFWFENIGHRTKPEFAPGKVVAWAGKYLIGDAHSGVALADFDGDGLIDLDSGRFWERTELAKDAAAPRDFGGLWRNKGSRTSPRFARVKRAAPFTERFQPCDAVRQNSVRACDWDQDGRLDLLAGDTDGFVWYFRNVGRALRPAQGGASRPDELHQWSLFAPGEKLRAAGQPLRVTTGGHARLDVCDWNRDGRNDLLIADGAGTLTLFLGHRAGKLEFLAGRKMLAESKPIQRGARASVLVCDWDQDGRQDVVMADEHGYFFYRNAGGEPWPQLAAPAEILFGGKRVRYTRPNLGSFVDWDGDGKRDLVACHFENDVRFYRNVGAGTANAEPEFRDPEGVVLLRGESPQMLSGVEVTDWNHDGDLDLLTGQGHGGSGLRFYEHDWLEDELRDTHPRVVTRETERKPD